MLGGWWGGSSRAQTATSVNVLFKGGGNYTLIANPLNSTNNTFAGLFSHLPSGTQLLKWNRTNQDFEVFGKVPFGSGWSPASGATATLNPGEGAFVFLLGNDFTNTFVGEPLQGNLTNRLGVGYNLVGNMAPDGGSIAQIQLKLPSGSQILTWTAGELDYTTYSTISESVPPRMPTISAGQGFFIFTLVPFEWVRNYSTP